MSRKPIIAGNWKMHNNLAESKKLVVDIKELLKNEDKSRLPEVVVAPVFTALSTVAAAINYCECGCGCVNIVKLSSQNCFYEDKGAYTGEISVPMLRDIGCEYIIIGHSERRQYFGETDEMINKKAKAILNHGLIPIICCGETLRQREDGVTDQHCETQIRAALLGLTNEEIAKSVIAYEPIWAIGTGKTCDANEADRTIGAIRNVVKALSDEATGDAIRILYGGSVKPDTIDEQMAKENIDGALVGGASLDAAGFARIVQGAM